MLSESSNDCLRHWLDRLIMILVGFLTGVAIKSIATRSSDGIRFMAPSPKTLHTKAAETKQPFDPVSFAFYAMGDTPYGYRDEIVLERQIINMHENIHNKALFLVHLGDLQRAERTGCSEEAFKKTRDYLVHFPLTTLVIPGDNDYHKCPHPRAAWNLFTKYFLYSERLWPNAKSLSFPVARWKENPEMFVFEKDGILFLSVNLMDEAPKLQDIKLEWDRRNQDNLKWIDKNVRHALSSVKQQVLRGVIIFGHSVRSPSTRPFFEGLYSIFEKTPEIKVIYLHGDGHVWKIDDNFAKRKGWDSFREVQVDRGGLADLILIEIAGFSETGETLALAKEKEPHYIFGDGLFRIDRQTGVYPE